MLYNYLPMLMAAPPAANGEAAPVNPLMQFLPIILMFVILWFLIIRPQRNQQKKQLEMLNNIKIHDTVVTTGGIIGKVVNIKKEKNILVVRIDETNNTKIEIQRHAIAGVISNEEVKS
ncbi:MAG: preprotein translocase subunit YajC [Candidatus Cloacimonetes bacterium]|nr:preprotein translocase subunit YajC [Candidatus Cloacimonadota bacterium]